MSNLLPRIFSSRQLSCQLMPAMGSGAFSMLNKSGGQTRANAQKKLSCCMRQELNESNNIT